ncbi:acyltransferase [Arthrobacter sp. VKM Ac-2550]|uniref:acyltransferase n=1 Tax=Crystallibacter permensis TaxID=1938888 RepID=UPI002225F240|nr:acyltransferase [Arthrobacter sp. VKM Ac-2550]MCW2131199.1 Surface polysaccharide O-acyltransferase, integral membrane enzyme [Arthrobacter sp. VKM Ac-2550]
MLDRLGPMAEPVQPVGQPESTEPAPAATPARARNYALDLLRIVSIVGVVAIHSFGELAGDDSARNQRDWLPAAVIDIAFIWVVPVFVIISGTLTLAPRAHTTGAGDFYRKRALRLVPALIFWHLVYIFVGNWLILGRELHPAETLADVFNTSVYPHLYFLWLILGLYLAAPPLARYLHSVSLRKATRTTAVVLALILLLFMAQAASIQAELGWQYPWNMLTQWFPYLGYFMAGWVLAQMTISIRTAATLGGAAVVLSIFNIWHWINQDSTPVLNVITPSSYVGLGVTLAALCIFTSVFHLLKDWRPVPRLAQFILAMSNAAFGVFLNHYLILTWLTFKVLGEDLQPTLATMTFKFTAATVGAFILSYTALRIPWLRRVF